MIDLTIDLKNIPASFERIASDLMNNYVLVCDEKQYRLAEIEFYYHNKDSNHEDIYTHNHDRQKTSGEWYAHRSGLDITIGDSESCGGILIRAIQNVGDKSSYVYGPIKCKTELFESIGRVNCHKMKFGLESTDILDYEEVITMPRIGLNPSKSDGFKYFDKSYRYIVLPQKEHPGKEKARQSMLDQGKSKGEVKEIWGW